MDSGIIDYFLDALCYSDKLDGRRFMAGAVTLYLEEPTLMDESYDLFCEKLSYRLGETAMKTKFVLSRTSASSWQNGKLYVLFERHMRYTDEQPIITAIARNLESGLNRDDYREHFRRMLSDGYEERLYRKMTEKVNKPVSYTDI